MTELERWIAEATKGLAAGPAARVRAEIEQHCEAARREGAGEEAVGALGDAREANCQYRRVLLTKVEERLLRSTQREARLIGRNPWLKAILLTMPVAALLGAGRFFTAGEVELARVVLAGAVVLGLGLVGPMMWAPTGGGGRAYRWAKWTAWAVLFWLAASLDGYRQGWLMCCCLWQVVWVEWTQASMRRKLRVAKWPRLLYF